MKRANIIKSKSKQQFVVYPVNTMSQGGGIASEPYVILDSAISYVELSKKVLEVLNQSKTEVEKPKNWKDFSKNHMKSMGFKTMKELHTDSISVGALINNRNLTLSPTKNMGSRKGFQYSKSLESITLPDDSSIEEIAKALEEALLRCEY